MNRDSQIEKRLRAAIKYFWLTRQNQAQRQGAASGSKDAGARSAVTGGAQMNGFIKLVRDLLCESGLPRAHVMSDAATGQKGGYREPAPELGFQNFIASLLAKAIAVAKAEE